MKNKLVTPTILGLLLILLTPLIGNTGGIPSPITFLQQNARTPSRFSKTLHNINMTSMFCDNKALQDQYGDGNESKILQHGSFNDGAGYGERYGAIAIQSGEGNYSDISQVGDRNYVYIGQSGNLNFSRVKQSGNDNFASVGQYGNNNYVDIYQAGSKNYGAVRQFFSSNSIVLSQSGGNYASYVQYGNKSCQVTQTPGAPSVTVIQQ